MGEYETFEGNPRNSNDNAVDVAEPAAAEPSTRGPVVQELHADARQPDGSRSLSAGHPAKRAETTVHAAQKDRLSQVSHRRK